MVEVKEIERDFRDLQKDLLGILLFGSRAEGESHARSDTDVCLVAGERRPAEIMRKAWQRGLQEKYDCHVFEELPLYLQAQVMEKGKIVWAQSKPELSYYFYFYRKLWDDQRHRNAQTKQELLAGIR